MSDLITAGDMLTITDAVEAIYSKIKTAVGASGGSDILGTAEDILDAVLAVDGASNYYVVADHLKPAHDLIGNCSYQTIAQYSILAFINTLDQHCSQRGLSVSSTISDLSTFATYRNAGDFKTCLYKPLFAEAYLLLVGKTLAAANVYAPAIDGSDVLGMGKRTVGGAFAAGAANDHTKYIGGKCRLKVTTQLEGTGVPVVTATGVDHTGAPATWTFTQGAFPVTVGTYDFNETATKWVRSISNIAVTGTTATSGVCLVVSECPR